MKASPALYIFLLITFRITSAYSLRKELVYVKQIATDIQQDDYPPKIQLVLHKEQTDDALFKFLLRNHIQDNDGKSQGKGYKQLTTTVSKKRPNEQRKSYRVDNTSFEINMQKSKGNAILLWGDICINGSLFRIEPVNEDTEQSPKHAIYQYSHESESCLISQYKDFNEDDHEDSTEEVEYLFSGVEEDDVYDIKRSEELHEEKFQQTHDESTYNLGEDTNEEESRHNFVLFDAFSADKHEVNRVKRNTSPLTVELLFVVDYAAYSWWKSLIGDEEDSESKSMTLIRQYYAYVFQGIDKRFSTIDKQPYTIDLAFSGLFVAKSEDESYWTTNSIIEGDGESPRVMVNSSEALDKFQEWLDRADFLPKFDHAMLFTGTNLTYAGSPGNRGLAFASSMCRNISNSSIVEDVYDTRTIIFATQQIARSLGTRDDMDNNDCLEFFNYIMAPKLRLPIKSFAANRWSFSTCSEQYLNEYISELNKNGLNCLKETSVEERYPSSLLALVQELPGVIYSGNRQCEQRFGRGSDVCREAIGTSYSKICMGLLCTVPGQERCDYILPADGTPCGNKKYCWQGSCTIFDDGQEILDDCPFGNDPNIDCEMKVVGEAFQCYSDAIRYKCCETCNRFETGIVECEYGDRTNNCSIRDCVYSDQSYASETCCLTCADGPTPYASPLASTTDILTESSSVTTKSQSTMLSTPSFSTETSSVSSPLFSTSSHSSQSATTTSLTRPVTTAVDLSNSTKLISDETSTVVEVSPTLSSFSKENAEELATTGKEEDTTLSPVDKTDKTLATNLLSTYVTPSATVRIKSKTTSSDIKTTRKKLELEQTKERFTVSSVRVTMPAVTSAEIMPCNCSTLSASLPRATPTPRKANCSDSPSKGINDTLLERMFFTDLARSMQASQRLISRGVHQNFRSLYLTISGQLSGFNREYENENESGREGSESPSLEEGDIIRKLKPLWGHQYVQMMQDLEYNIKEMRYRVLSMFSRHLRYKGLRL